jgi:serine/threonine protein phosphatase 1
MRQFFSAQKRHRPPRLPGGVRVYAVGDVHGRADLLAQLLSQIDAHVVQNPVLRPIEVFVGDYVDRGLNSRGVIDLLISRRNSHETILLKGNHEKYIFDFLRDPKTWNRWRQYGGLETLLSYGLRPQTESNSTDQEELARTFADRLPREHLLFLSCLETSFTLGDFFFVHAGVKPGIPLDQQAEKNLLGIRDEFLRSKVDFGKYIVHGHTPVGEPDIRANRANIDTGAFVTGRLTCLVIEGERMQTLAPNGDGARKIADQPPKATVAAPPVLELPEIPYVIESNFTIAPKQTNETIEDAGGACKTQSASAEHALGARTDLEQHADLPHVVHLKASDERSLTGASGLRRPRTIRSSIFAVLLLTAVTLIVPILVPRWQVGTNLGGAKSHVVGSGVTEPGSDAAQAAAADPSARLILLQSIDQNTVDGAPLGIRVSGRTAGSFVEIDGVPAGVTLSLGRQLGSSRWRIPATDVAHAVINAPQGISGETDLAIELRLADDSVIDRGSLHLQRPPASPIVATQTNAPVGELDTSGDPTSKIPVAPTTTDQDTRSNTPASRLDGQPVPLPPARPPLPARDARVSGKLRPSPEPQDR